jgi:hypothetical protein
LGQTEQHGSMEKQEAAPGTRTVTAQTLRLEFAEIR